MAPIGPARRFASETCPGQADGDPAGTSGPAPGPRRADPAWVPHPSSVPQPSSFVSRPRQNGPAAAQRLEGQADGALLQAIRYHTVGHPGLDRLGRALYLADFLEPGREFAAEWRAGLAARVPDDLDGVLVEVLGSRIQHVITARKPLRAETAAFWSSVVTGR